MYYLLLTCSGKIENTTILFWLKVGEKNENLDTKNEPRANNDDPKLRNGCKIDTIPFQLHLLWQKQKFHCATRVKSHLQAGKKKF
jgi:hypothetical protein